MKFRIILLLSDRQNPSEKVTSFSSHSTHASRYPAKQHLHLFRYWENMYLKNIATNVFAYTDHGGKAKVIVLIKDRNYTGRKSI